ncbi:TonB-dependent receptor plug domain-containing protein [Mucilaginibacter calamicampi]|uniref:TonB-dependent receptor plug domain-containing protein n=1 Tax=Mucilaginibacter calamicampi TaxID=1302352 RepID=A0ABW2Z129_9SPHI
MPELFTLLIKVNIALALFCLGYYLVLRKLTFYTLNRVYLVGGIIFSSIYPFIDLSVFAQRHQDIVAPVQNVVIIWQAPAEHFIKQAAYWNWLEVLFWTGAALFTIRLLFQLVSLYKIYSRSTKREINGQIIRVVNGDISPFSFWQSIYINPEKLSAGDLNNIIEHEQVHVKEWHTLDVLLTEISVIFYWFNPGIWMMKRAVRENIEFITDRKILQKGMDSKAYQYSLLNVTFNQPAPAITSNFNFSTLKKRIMMMNAKRSSNLNLTRYAFLMPVVVVCLFIFSLSKAETVKASPTFKAVSAAVENIKSIVFNADTTPVKKAVKQTSPTKKANAVGNKSVATQTASNLTPSINIRNLVSSDSVVYVINNRIATVQIFNKLDFNEIESINIIKGNATDFLSKISDAGTARRGNANGAIVVTLKNALNGGASSLKYTDGYGNVSNGVVARAARPADTTGLTIRGATLRDDAPLIIVDGRERSSINSIDPNDIETVSVFKDARAINAYASYGERAKNGVIVITTKNGKYSNGDLYDKLIVVDGKIETERSLKEISADRIESFTLLKGASAVPLYGEKAKNGAIIITTYK